MQGSKLGLVIATLMVAGVSGCALPNVLPLTGATTQGPSPYGPWYEQHWATNSVLLAAADQPEDFIDVTDGAAVDAAMAAEGNLDGFESAPVGPDPALEVSTVGTGNAQEFTDSSPYQFPASSFSAPSAEVSEAAQPSLSTPPASPEKQTVPPPSGPIRY
jgi:hypothetical protein